MTDVTTGCKAWTRNATNTINYRDRKFVYEVESVVRAARLGMRITQVPVRYHNRQGGTSGRGCGWREIKSIMTCGANLLLCATRIRLGGVRKALVIRRIAEADLPRVVSLHVVHTTTGMPSLRSHQIRLPVALSANRHSAANGIS